MKNKWFILAVVAFLLNGLGAFMNKLVATNLSNGQFQSTYLIFVYLGGISLSLILIKVKKIKIKKKDLIIGFAAGLFSLLGMSASFLALLYLKAYIVFPINQIGMLILITLISFLVFKEKLKSKEMVGLALGILAIVLISV